ncbi:MAG TPA: dTMP kinase [Candidatus Baltobacteraceae bacterium]|nr:dTMP kinase [Candidatus Baltobacteraceae bacterium]
MCELTQEHYTPQVKRGLLIAFEGIDASGKTTHSEMLQRWIGNSSSVLTREPSAGRIGKFTKNEVRKNEDKFSDAAIQTLFIADRIDHLDRLILPMMEKGMTVITDRYMYSTMTYGAAHGIDMESLMAIHKSLKVPEADIIFYIRISPEVAMARAHQRMLNLDERFENIKSQAEISKAYDRLIAMNPERWVIIDGEKSVDEVQRQIIDEWKKFSQGVRA